MATRIELPAVDLAARTEIIRWANERLQIQRNKLEDPKCEDRHTIELRARIAELKTLIKQLEGDSTET